MRESAFLWLYPVGGGGEMTAKVARGKVLPSKNKTWATVWNFRHIYLFMLPAIIWYLVFSYYPMYGILIAFKDFKYNLGILGSPWEGFRYFKQFLSDSS